MVDGDFEWDDKKAADNLKNHGVSFEEAASAVLDPNALYQDDGSGTGRVRVVGFSLRTRLLCVVYVERGQRDRIISAWLATNADHTAYTTP